MALGVYITSVIVVILLVPLVYTLTMFDALVEADKRNYCMYRIWGSVCEGNNNMGKYVCSMRGVGILIPPMEAMCETVLLLNTCSSTVGGWRWVIPASGSYLHIASKWLLLR